MLKDRWYRFVERIGKWEDAWMNRLFTPSTYRGTLCFLAFSCAATYLMWNIDEILVWTDGLRGTVSYINYGKQRWSRIWAVIIGGSGILASLFAIATITMLRWRERKSAKGPWFTRVSKAEKELALMAAQREKEKREAETAQSKQIREDVVRQGPSTPDDTFWDDEPQEPAGIQPPPKAEPPKQFGNVRLEKSDGRATLVVPKKNS